MTERRQGSREPYSRDHFLGRLVDKAAGRALAVAPRLLSIFEPASAFEALSGATLVPVDSVPSGLDQELAVRVRASPPTGDGADRGSFSDRAPDEPFEHAQPGTVETPPCAAAGAAPTAAPGSTIPPPVASPRPAAYLSINPRVVGERSLISTGPLRVRRSPTKSELPLNDVLAPFAPPRLRRLPGREIESALGEMPAPAVDDAIPADFSALRPISGERHRAGVTRNSDTRDQAQKPPTDDGVDAVSFMSSPSRRMIAKARGAPDETASTPGPISGAQPAITRVDALVPSEALSAPVSPPLLAGSLARNGVSRLLPPSPGPPEKRGSHPAEQRWTSSPAAVAPTINVTIGRIEVRAVSSPPASTRNSSAAGAIAPMSLEGYLNQRRERR